MMWGAQITQGLTLRGAGAARSAVQSDAELWVTGGVLWGALTEVRDSVHVYSVFEKTRQCPSMWWWSELGVSTVPGPVQTVPRRMGKWNTVKDLRCKRVKEEEYEDLDEYELEYTTDSAVTCPLCHPTPPCVSPSLSRIERSSMWLRPETVYEEQRHEAKGGVRHSLTASNCGRVNGMKIILARQLELERKGLHWGRKL